MRATSMLICSLAARNSAFRSSGGDAEARAGDTSSSRPSAPPPSPAFVSLAVTPSANSSSSTIFSAAARSCVSSRCRAMVLALMLRASESASVALALPRLLSSTRSLNGEIVLPLRFTSASGNLSRDCKCRRRRWNKSTTPAQMHNRIAATAMLATAPEESVCRCEAAVTKAGMEELGGLGVLCETGVNTELGIDADVVVVDEDMDEYEVLGKEEDIAHCATMKREVAEVRDENAERAQDWLAQDQGQGQGSEGK
ncbi:hypothetical protein C8R45DRAFT_985794 [Mycena sanguinolenta]|nr:hypothetical protein C8R45DRAFT_985794 [Mycena sanguinolenta]